jgi:DNA-binding transcriptional LysR family regulator
LQDGRELQMAVPSRVIVNNAESYIACCRAGLGLIQIPRFDVQYLLDAGELVEVMQAHRAAPWTFQCCMHIADNARAG